MNHVDFSAFEREIRLLRAGTTSTDACSETRGSLGYGDMAPRFVLLKITIDDSSPLTPGICLVDRFRHYALHEQVDKDQAMHDLSTTQSHGKYGMSADGRPL